MKRIAWSLLLLGCGDDGGGDATSSTGQPASTTEMATGVESTTVDTTGPEPGSTSTGAPESESGATSTGAGVDVVSCVALPNEIAEMECGGAFAVRLCVGDGVCEFTNGCECAAGEAQIELRTDPPNLEIRSVGEWTVADCDGQEPIDAMGTGCRNLPADTPLAFPLDDGVGNQVLFEVRKNGSEAGVWSLLAFTAQ